jgi:hypothetical protein
MKTLAEMLQDADPLAYEPRRSAQERGAKRHTVLEASQPRTDAPRRSNAIAPIVAVAIVAMALGALRWSSLAVDAVAAVRFEVRLAEDTPAPDLREVVVAGTARRIYLHAEPVVVNSDIDQAQVIQGDNASTFGVSLTFNADGGAKMRRATQGHIGRPLAILIDGEVVSAPVVRSAISTAAMISGTYLRAEAQRIVDGIVGREKEVMFVQGI